ncbi:MAG: 8-amino-7-oxononanoate synthase [Heliobacteriaceae bacterium]|jgi:8-amino-7-oxononanoate synthase|nr:8-amino-7-oxononanoate synthase [Heliobacteriaceae bacterium]
MYSEILNELERNFHLRKISNIAAKDEKYIYIDGQKLLNLSSNNYLGLADNKAVTQRFLNDGGDKYSFGSASARLLTGNLPVYNELENLITDLFGTEKTLLFNSGYHANVGIMSALGQRGSMIYSDRANHASIIDGIRLSRAKFHRYRTVDDLSTHQLINSSTIVTESLFSMDGNIADLAALVELKKRHNCLLVVDEAHAFGVFGDKGLGIAENLGLINEIDLIMGTFGKAIGSFGAFVTGKKVLIDYLINKARPFIFSTALPPVNAAFSKWILENELPKTREKRQKMLALANRLGSQSQIIPVVVGDNQKTIELCETLYNSGYFTLPIRPPTVPEGTSRIRISLTTEIDKCDITGLTKLITTN